MLPFRFDVVSLLPQAFGALDDLGVIGRAFSSNLAELKIYNPRDFTLDRYRKVDDEPYGGGVGMVLKPELFFEAFESISKCSGILSPSIKTSFLILITSSLSELVFTIFN